MEFFKSVLRVFGLLEPAKVDFITELPLEVSQLILRKMDPESLLSVAQVSQNWLNVCKSDKILRRTVRHHKRSERRRMRTVLFGTSSPPKRRVETSRKLKELKKVERNVPLRTFIAAHVFGTPKSRRTRPNVTTINPHETCAGRRRRNIRM